MTSLEFKFREWVESVEYQKDFKKLKKLILLLREQEKRIKGIHPIRFTRIALPKPQDTAVRHERIPLKELQDLLKNGNVNDHRVLIPDVYSDFKVNHRLKYFFDPGKPYPKFSPFDDNPIVSQLPLNAGTKIQMTVDISFSSKLLEREFKAAIRRLKEMWKLKEQRQGRYPVDELFKVKKLMAENLKQMQIYKQLYPEQSANFTYGVPNGSKPEQYYGWKKYIRVGRIMEIAKTLKP
jgi:hypothetical protein